MKQEGRQKSGGIARQFGVKRLFVRLCKNSVFRVWALKTGYVLACGHMETLLLMIIMVW